MARALSLLAVPEGGGRRLRDEENSFGRGETSAGGFPLASVTFLTFGGWGGFLCVVETASNLLS